MAHGPKRPVSLTALTLAATALIATALPAAAQDSRKHLTLIGIPSGTVAPGGMVFGSLALTDRRTGTAIRDNDGSLALGFGLGSAEDGIGVQVTASIASLSRDFGDAGSFSIKASRRIGTGQWTTYLGASADYLAPWGDVKGQDVSGTVALTSFTSVRIGADVHPLMLTLGGGSHIRNNDNDPGIFAGVGIGLTPHLAASAAWTSEALDLGLGVKAPGVEGLNFTFAVNDVTDRRDSRRVTLTATWAVANVFGR
ncbi:hypothetical protein [Szabonella alba]|uniref:Outer membrane protein beta-barrel domain-containing protein n=1 Tax=Szabonella alba TaxID=2804194 RepID=A0A8K0V5N3_9RHOB|nr:hypothetical protein [Szabonella alba]MBL4915848.1 hypothetical protein [Szabonella alba]